MVQAPPGTGKTTLVPPLLANLASTHGLAQARALRVVVTQPRRVAARAAARRLAALDGTQVGDRVGYTVRGERKAGPGTLVEFVTPGILLRRLLDDPGLESTGAVILDEVHERGLETDLLLGMLGEVRQLRGDLTLVAMSATLDAPRFAALIGGCTPEQQGSSARRRRPGSRRRLPVSPVPAGGSVGSRGRPAARRPRRGARVPGPRGGYSGGRPRRRPVTGSRHRCPGVRPRSLGSFRTLRPGSAAGLPRDRGAGAPRPGQPGRTGPGRVRAAGRVARRASSSPPTWPNPP